MDALSLAGQTLLSPMVLFFVLGLAAALARSDLTIPEAAAKTISLYLMLAIGFKGGVELSTYGLDATLVRTLIAGVALSFMIPVVAFFLLKATSKLPPIEAAAVAAHYGSISIVTFVAGTQMVQSTIGSHEGYLVAVAAAMETPAILTALLLASRYRSKEASDAQSSGTGHSQGELVREVLLNPSVVVLVGAMAIGAITGEQGMTMMKPFIVDPFRGVLCLFLLDMGLIAGRGLRAGGRSLSLPVVLFGLYMPLIGAGLAALCLPFLGLSVGGSTLFLILAASASYIAVPAAMRLALPEARPSVYVTLSLGVTFPFNLTIGLPIYLLLAQAITGG
jgi:hypothetical protein